MCDECVLYPESPKGLEYVESPECPNVKKREKCPNQCQSPSQSPSQESESNFNLVEGKSVSGHTRTYPCSFVG
jgi:hypothetical protein